MTPFESNPKLVPCRKESVYAKLSDLSNLKNVANHVPPGNLRNLRFEEDFVIINIPPAGDLKLRISQCDPEDGITYEASQSPLPFNLHVSLTETSEHTCGLQVTLNAELNTFMQSMLQKPLRDGVEKLAEMLSLIPYEGRP